MRIIYTYDDPMGDKIVKKLNSIEEIDIYDFKLIARMLIESQEWKRGFNIRFQNFDSQSVQTLQVEM